VNDVSESGELSRRALREAETGSIPVFDGPPLTRRERKMREEMIATGVIPVQAPAAETPAPPAVDQPSPAPIVAPDVPAAAVPVETPVVSAAVVAQPDPAVEQVVPEPPAQPLTRRELREQLRGRAPKKQPAVAVPAAPVEPPALEPVMDVPALVAPPLAPVEEPVDEEKAWPVLDAPVSSPVAPVIEDEPVVAVEEVDEGVAVDTTEVIVGGEPTSVPPVVDEPSVEEPEETVVPPLVPLPPVFAPTTSRDTETAPALEVGPAAPATHALILPVAPSIDVTGPLGDTGEIIVTGNIPLPRVIAETGLTGVVDAEIDDDDYSDYVDPESGTYTQPVRALDAVSSRSLEIDQPLIHKPRWGSLAITLGVSASILGVTAISLLALALFTNVFGL
jgi:hypothetical protein